MALAISGSSFTCLLRPERIFRLGYSCPGLPASTLVTLSPVNTLQSRCKPAHRYSPSGAVQMLPHSPPWLGSSCQAARHPLSPFPLVTAWPTLTQPSRLKMGIHFPGDHPSGPEWGWEPACHPTALWAPLTRWHWQDLLPAACFLCLTCLHTPGSTTETDTS